MQRRHKGRWAVGLLTAFLFLPSVAQELCVSCHGPDGNSQQPGVPSIAGQPKLFLEHQLILMREGVRPVLQMEPIVKEMKDAEIARLAEHFSKLPARSMESAPASPKLMQQGMERAKALRCGVCHTPDFSGQDQIPRLAGQREQYLGAEMLAYRDGKRQGGDTVMAEALRGVSDADIKALAHFLARSSARAPAR